MIPPSFFLFMFSMPIFAPAQDGGYDQLQLVIVESEMELPKWERIACGLSFSGCYVAGKIYMTGWNSDTYWHEVRHHIEGDFHN